MKVALVVPPFDYGKMLYGLSKSTAFHNAVPLGAVSVAAYLREAGHQVQVIDAPALMIGVPEIREILRRNPPEAIGISATSVIWHSAAETARLLKTSFAVPVFVGGPHVGLYPEHSLETPEIDYAIFGEGEETAVELVAALDAGVTVAGIDGVAYRQDGQVVRNQPRSASRSLDTVPLPAYDLVDLSRYRAPPMRTRQYPALYMELFRGCAYAKCSYCTSSIGLQNRFRRHSPAIAAEKVAAIAQRYGAKEIAFVDDDFVVGKDWIHDFCSELRKQGAPVSWSCYVRASQVDQGVFQAMRAAGCHQVLMGMEVLDNRMLELLNKDLTVASCGAAVRAAHRAGLDVIGLFMVGVPRTTPESVYSSVEHALAQKLDVAVFSLYRPPPGSESYEELGWGPEDYIACFKKQKEAVYVPEAYRDIAHVEAVFKEAYRRFYTAPSFMGRTAWKALRDPTLARNALLGAATLVDQLRPGLRDLGRPSFS